MSSAPPASAGSARPAGSGSGAAASSGAQQHRRNSQRGGRNRSAASASNPHTAGLKPTTTRFVGKEEGLGAAFVYQAMVGSDASDQYTKTTEEIIRYATTKFTHGCDVEQSLTDGVLLDLPLPMAPTAIAPAVVPDAGELLLWKMQAQMVLAKRQTLQDNMKGAYALIQGQCSEAVLEKVRAQANYSTVQLARDPIGLLGLLRGVMYNYDSRKHRAVAIIELSGLLAEAAQARHQSDADYLDKFRTKLSVLVSAGGTGFFTHEGLLTDALLSETPPVTRTTATVIQLGEAGLRAKHKMEGILFLLRSIREEDFV